MQIPGSNCKIVSIHVQSGGCADAVIELVRDWRSADGTLSRDFSRCGLDHVKIRVRVIIVASPSKMPTLNCDIELIICWRGKCPEWIKSCGMKIMGVKHEVLPVTESSSQLCTNFLVPSDI